MYRVNYYTTEKKDIISNKWFKTLREATEFSVTLQPSQTLIDIKYYDPNDPNAPKPPMMNI